MTLEELVQNRNDLIEAHRKNNFTDGIHALLTDLYPDTAHFIYELLQNAEDMKATAVRFILDKNGIDFEHNGTKRAFNIEDIDAITNIGHNSQKKDDPTSIGKFGVGFKAVFAYTATPIIHSGKYHFKIRDYFVPEFRDVEKVRTTDSDGVPWTKFSFPFNNPKKPASTAYEECLEGLIALDSSAILFLQNIKKIEYMLPLGDYGYVVRNDKDSHHVTVAYQTPTGKDKVISDWLRFCKSINIVDDQGKTKELSIAVAFALTYDSRYKQEKITSVKGGGRTFIYFPAEKEHSGLRFHINAPFASTVARDSVRSCADNVKLIRAIAELINESLPEIKEQGLMNHSFFEVLPHNKDELSIFYQYVFDYIYTAFQKNEYIPTRNGGYTSAQNALAGPVSISNVFNENAMQKLFNIQKTWIVNAAQKNSHVDNFIKSLDIETFTFEDFTQIFEPSARENTEYFLKGRKNNWLKSFYALCADVYDDLGCYDFLWNMQQTLAIRSTMGEMHRSSEIFILPINESLMTRGTPIVEPMFVYPAKKGEKICDKIRYFFREELEIQEYGPKVEVEKLLRKYDKDIEVNDQYYQDLLVFAKYNAEHNDIDFSEHEIFLYSIEEDDSLYITKASELYLGKAYGNAEGTLLASIYEKNCIWDGYAEYYDEKELEKFVDFVSSCGILKGFSIVEQQASYHPLFASLLNVYGRYTGYGFNYDYTIPKLEELLKMQSLKISKQIWDALERYGKKGRNREYLKARYAPNASAMTRSCDSTLIYYLKKYAWLPNRQGKLFRPEDITISNLHTDFHYDSQNYLLEALGIGSVANKQRQEQEKLEQVVRDLKKKGYGILPEDQIKEYRRWKAQQRVTKNIAPMSGQDLLKKQKKQSIGDVDLEDAFFVGGAVDNVTRRAQDVEATFRNAKQMKPAQRKLFGRVVESTKEERKVLRNWYQGRCQMCNTRIIGYNRVPHFIAKNIINTQHLSVAISQTTNLAWNSLCLCPNCAAKYDVCSRDLNGLYEQIVRNNVIEDDATSIVLTIELDGKLQEIHYTPMHFLALKKVMQLIDCETKQ